MQKGGGRWTVIYNIHQQGKNSGEWKTKEPNLIRTIRNSLELHWISSNTSNHTTTGNASGLYVRGQAIFSRD
jgi:hypothetical protein